MLSSDATSLRVDAPDVYVRRTVEPAARVRPGTSIASQGTPHPASSITERITGKSEPSPGGEIDLAQMALLAIRHSRRRGLRYFQTVIRVAFMSPRSGAHSAPSVSRRAET